MNLYSKSLLLSIAIVFTIFLSSQIIYAFDDGVFWESPSYFIGDAPAGSGLFDRFEIYDPVLDGNGGPLDQLSVTVQSKTLGGAIIETLNLVLTETADDGIFGIDHILFMAEEAEFDIGDTAIITVYDPCDVPADGHGNCDSLAIETLSGSDSVLVFSDTSLTDVTPSIGIVLTETGPNTSIFTGQLRFSTTSSDEPNGILLVSSGDVFTIEDQITFLTTDGLISGPNRFAIIVQELGTVEVTATPSIGGPPITHSTDIGTNVGVGRGGGGLVRPGLVIDAIASIISDSSGDGSGCADCNPPTLGIDSNLKRIVKNGFSYNNNPVNVNLYYTPYPLVKVNVGQENKVVLKVYEDGGTQNIEHIGLGFGLAEGESFSDSKATINIDRTRDGSETVSTYDPERVFDNVRIQSERGSCDGSIQTNCMIFTIYHTFRAPLKFDMVATYVWDFKGNAWQNYYNHGIHITGESINPPKTQSVAFGTKEMHGMFTLTQVDIFEDKWIDEFGNLYVHMGNDRFDKIYTVPKKIILDYVTMHGCDRLCNWFESYKEHQDLLAKAELEKMLLGKEIASEPKGFTPSLTSNMVSRAEDVDLQNRITSEINKATELFEKLFDIKTRF